MQRLVVALGILGLAACQGGPDVSSTEQAVVIVSPLSYDFGTVLVGTPSAAKTIVVNPGPGPNDDYVTSVTESCPDFSVSAPGLPAEVYRDCEQTCDPALPTCQQQLICTTLDSGNYTFTATFKPTVAGAVSCVVTVTVNNTTTHTVTLSGTGMLPPVEIQVQPTSVAFGDVRRNTDSTAATVTVKNVGGSTMHVSSATISSGFAISSGSTGAYTVAPSGAQTYKLVCHPTATGALAGSFTITSDAPGSPTKVPLTCNGVDSNLDLQPSPAMLPTTRVGQPVQMPIAIVNSGTAGSTVEAVAVTGDMTLVSGPSAGTVLAASGGHANVVVAYAAAAAGDASGTLTVTHDGGQVRTAQISGTALATSMSLTPDGVVDFGPVCSGQTKQQSFSILANEDGGFVVQQIADPPAPFAVMAPTLPATVQGGGTNMVSFDVTASPTAAGVAMGSFDVTTDIPNAAPHTIDLAVTGLAAGVTATPSELDLGSNPIDQTTIAQSVHLTNCSTDPITLSNARIEGPDASEFAIVAQPDSAMLASTGLASWLIVLQAHTPGVKQADFAVDYDGGTATVTLDGEGLGSDGSGLGSNSTGTGRGGSYYACSAGGPSAAWPIGLALLALVVPRRRRAPAA